MLRRSFLVLALLFEGSIIAQSLDSLIVGFNQNIDYYLMINPHDRPVPIDSTYLTDLEKKEYRRQYSDTTRTIEPIELQAFYAYRVDSIIALLFDHPELMKRNLEDELNCHVILSSDRRFLQISYPENSGGTYQSRIVHYLYQSAEESFLSIYVNEGHGVSLDEDGYHSVEYLGTRDDTSFYFFTGGVRGCSYCFSSSAGILAASADGISELESIEVNSRDWSETIRIEAESDSTKSIYVKYQVDDLSGPCYCEGKASEGLGETQGPFYCTYTYRYYNYHLYLVEQGCIYLDPLEKENSEDNRD